MYYNDDYQDAYDPSEFAEAEILTEYDDDDGWVGEYDDDDGWVGEYDDDDGWAGEYDDDGWAGEYDDDDGEMSEDDTSERRRRRRGRSRRYRRLRVAKGRRFRRGKTAAYRGRGVIRTPAGQAMVKLPKNLTTKKELKVLETKVLANNNAILKNGKAIISSTGNLKKLDQNLSSRIRRQASKLSKTTKQIDSVQQSVLFNSLLGGSDLNSISIRRINANNSNVNPGKYLKPDGTGTDNSSEAAIDVLEITNTDKDNSNAILPLVLSGGLGGGTGSSSNNMLPLLMMTSMGNDNSDNSGLLLALAMMGNK